MKLFDVIGHLFWRIYEAPFVSQYPRELNKALRDCQTLLDLGCGTGAQIERSKIKLKKLVGVDIFENSAQEAKSKGIYDDILVMDILNIFDKFDPKSFDAVLCSDVIEHLDKQSAYRLMEIANRFARKKIIVFTPNGFFPQGEKEKNPYQVHLSGWTVPEMRSMGFQKIIGIHGLKILCKKFPEPLSKPYWLWRGLSSLTGPLVYRWPSQAFQILCIKRIANPYR